MVLSLVVALAGCAPTASDAGPSLASEPSVSSVSPSPMEPARAIAIEQFAALGDDPVPGELAADLQAVLERGANGDGMTAAVISPQGTWSGATGLAAGDRPMVPNDQMSIAHITFTLVAAQVMQLVEAGELSLDDLAADRLPPDFEFDTNGATIADLLSMRSGIPDVSEDVFTTQDTDPLVTFTPYELLASVAPDRSPAGQDWEYTGTNPILLGLIIEQATGRPIAQVLRSGVLAGDGYERLIYQPDERPSDPMAMPLGASAASFNERGGYLPSIGAVGSPEDAMASDAPTLARWFRNFCAGQVVSPVAVAEMTDFQEQPGYGVAIWTGQSVGAIGGAPLGYSTLALCFPNPGIVVVVLANAFNDVEVTGGNLANAARTP
jgi:D-alanyl-D-alanine carboxypeptidase